MDKLGKLQIIKPILVKVLSEIKLNFPWLDYSELKIGRDSSLSDDEGTTVMLYFQICTDSEGNELEPPLGYRKAEHYKDIYEVVGKVLSTRLRDDKHIASISGGTWSRITNIPEINKALDKSYYGVAVQIEY